MDNSWRNQEWYVVTNDLIGGVAISLEDAPLSAIDQRQARVVLADMIDEDVARYVTDRHNHNLRRDRSHRVWP